jgi:hypothetical protein
MVDKNISGLTWDGEITSELCGFCQGYDGELGQKSPARTVLKTKVFTARSKLPDFCGLWVSRNARILNRVE